jgi:hypothetical protein
MSSAETKNGGRFGQRFCPDLGPSRLAALTFDVGLDPGQSQLSDLADQGLDSLVFLNPLAHLREEILGDIDGSGFAFFLEGEEKAGMAWTGETMTAGTSAFFLNGDQTGGEQGSFGLEMFDAGLELLLDEGGVFGRFHIHRRIAESRLGITDKYKDLSEMARKSSGAKKEFFDEERGNLRTGDYRLEMRDFRRQIEVRKIDCSSELSFVSAKCGPLSDLRIGIAIRLVDGLSRKLFSGGRS